MKKIKAILCSIVFASMTSFSPLSADSSDFAGLYFGLQSSAVGVELDGSHAANEQSDDTTITSTGAIGKFAIIGGAEAGYAIPLGDTFMLDIGASLIGGAASFSTDTDDGASSSSDKVTFEADDFTTVYIAPTIAVGDQASIYLKLGVVDAETSVTGDVNKPGDLQGTLVGIGSRTLLNNSLFIRTEAGMIDFDQISTKGKGTSGQKGISTSTEVKADPTMAYGSVSVGVKF